MFTLASIEYFLFYIDLVNYNKLTIVKLYYMTGSIFVNVIYKEHLNFF